MHVRPDKFYPPRVDTPRFLPRKRVIDAILGLRTPATRAVLLVGQAGQGKTTVIQQYLNRLGADSAWYQVGPEDADPACFLASLRACLARLLPDGDLDPDAPHAGDLALYDLPRRVDALLEAIRPRLRQELHLVLDDLHHLIPHESSMFILDHLLEHAPPGLRFVLASRRHLPLASLAGAGPGRLVLLDNRDLALNRAEIADFFQQVFATPLSHQDVARLRETTDGWVMGALLLGLRMARGHDGAPGPEPGRRGGADMLEYFRRTVFDALEPRLRAPLLTLSLLEEIPVDLARTLTGEPRVGADLDDLARQNVFVRQLDPDGGVYGLHHLFRQFLRETAAASLDAAAVRDIHLRAGLYFERRGNPGRALSHLARCGDHEALELTLRRNGAAMLAANKTATLAAILGDVPQASLDQMGWACLFLALAHMDSAPARALPLLHRGLAVMARNNDQRGELLCLAHSISIHITTTGHYREGEGLLERAQELFTRNADALDPSTTILLARSLAMGHCIFRADTATAGRYAGLALNLARREGFVNFEAALLMVMGYIRIFAGDMSLARHWLELAQGALHNPDVGSFNRLAIRMMLCNFLFHDGQFADYFDQKAQMVAAMGPAMVSQSIAGPFFRVWEMDIALNQGRLEDVLDLAGAALAQDPPPGPHLRSQVLLLKAVGAAAQGQRPEALALAQESSRLRGLAGGAYFVALNALLSGLVHGLCGNTGQALALLDAGIEAARRMPTPYLEACGLMHRAGVLLRAHDLPQAAGDLRTGLGLMRRNAYRHFWAWTPDAMREALGFAVAQGIEPAYARTLAAERLDAAIEDDGTVVDLLEFRTLGGFAILHRGRPLLGAEALTPAQRELLCLLLAAPELKIAQDTAQLHFWPDSPPAAARIKFDTLVSRLRKTLAEALPDAEVHAHLLRDKGIIRLVHCRVDAHGFLAAAGRGLEHTRLQEHWQAGNAFARADALWGGEFAPGVSGDDTVRDFRASLTRTLARAALAWCPCLAEDGANQRAVDLAEKALRADPLNDALWALLYRLHGRGSAIQARQVLQRLAGTLRAEDYPEEDIADMVRQIAAAQDQASGATARAGASREPTAKGKPTCRTH